MNNYKLSFFCPPKVIVYCTDATTIDYSDCGNLEGAATYHQDKMGNTPEHAKFCEYTPHEVLEAAKQGADWPLKFGWVIKDELF